MMTFEDIVDMDWLDSHSVKGEPMDLLPNDYVDFNHYLSHDYLLSPKLEYASSPPPLLMASPPPAGILAPTAPTSCSAAAALAAASTTPPPPLTFPTTEQIKQLIELAKHQLALRTPNVVNEADNTTATTPNNTTNCTSTTADIGSSNEPHSTNTTTAAVLSSESPASPSASHLAAAHLANTTTSLFGNNPLLPDTVSPESLMKPSSDLLVIKTEQKQDGTAPCISRSSSPPSLIPDNTVTAMETDEESPSSLSPKQQQQQQHLVTRKTTTTTTTTSSSSLPNHNHRRDSLLGDDIGSLEAYAESDGIDIKKLTPKERRQLRNKISARNFRVRRKEYITTLEQQVSDHKKHSDSLAEQLGRIEDENKQLRQEVDSLKRQNLLLQQQQQ